MIAVEKHDGMEAVVAIGSVRSLSQIRGRLIQGKIQQAAKA